jgi:L-threonylcarbamoyladenylate synthase
MVGACDVGVESTIIDCTGDVPKILRPGAITAQMISASTGLQVVGVVEDGAIRVSGSLDAHYAPAAQVLLDLSPVAGQGFIAMADVVNT